MQLQVSGITPSTTRYRYLWGYYVRGFKPWVHCQACFRGTLAPGITADMSDGVVELPRPTHYFYLHGFASGPKAQRGALNLHLAVRPKAGSIAKVHSVFGPVFTIHGAEEIQIQDPITDSDLPDDEWKRCKNFRFGAQMYAAPKLGPTALRDPILTPR